MLSDYAKISDSRKIELDECFENQNWHDFEVKIHALKSTSKTIGALELSKKALALEEAAEKGETDFIREHYSGFI